MKKLTALTLVLVLCFTLLWGCTAEDDTPDDPVTPPEGENTDPNTADPNTDGEDENTAPSANNDPKEIRVARPYDITTLDAHEANDDGSYQILYYIGEGLVRYDGGEIKPGVAERWDQSEDGLTYTFHLRKDAQWSDGTALTAEDFRYAFIRLLDPEAVHYYADSGYIFKNGEAYFNGEVTADEIGVEVMDAHTLVITREYPSLETLHALSGHVFFPIRQDMVEAHGISYGSEAEKVVTNGPFTLTSWAHEDKIVMEKSETYWNKDAVNLNKITGIVGAEGETAVDMMMAGELDLLETGKYDNIEMLESSGFVVESFTSGYQFVHMNAGGMTEESARFMQNTNFRQALNYAINRDAIIKSVLTGAQAATRISSPNDMGVSGTMHSEYPYEGWPTGGDAAKAKECLQLALDELGATIDDVPTLSMLCFESAGSMTVLQAVQDMLLTTLGIECVIDPQPIQQMIGKATGGEWDFWYGGATLGTMDWMSSGSIAGGFDHTSPSAFRGYVNDEYVRLLHEAEQTLDIQVRKDNLFEMEKILCEDPGSIIIGWNQTYVVHTDKLSGLVVDTDSDYTFMDLAQ